MALNISIHKTILYQILKDIYSNKNISPFLGFKGGTAALIFYELDRFSVDLDFDLLDHDKEDIVFKEIETILKKYGTIKEAYKKKYTLFFLISYEKEAHNIKVEINRRGTISKYEVKDYAGLSMLVMTKNDMFSNKLLAMYERMGRANRDIYDVWFFLKNRFEVNQEIIKERTSLDFKDFIEKCIIKLERLDNRNILNGIGELLNNKQKVWVKNYLIKETINLLRLRKS